MPSRAVVENWRWDIWYLGQGYWYNEDLGYSDVWLMQEWLARCPPRIRLESGDQRGSTPLAIFSSTNEDVFDLQQDTIRYTWPSTIWPVGFTRQLLALRKCHLKEQELQPPLVVWYPRKSSQLLGPRCLSPPRGWTEPCFYGTVCFQLA